MIFRVLHLEAKNYSEETLNILRSLVTLECYDLLTNEQLVEILNKNQYDAIFTKIGLYLNQSVLQNQKNLKIIVSPTTGLNHIDLEYTSRKNIQIISLKGEYQFLKEVKSTAEHTWALLMALVRNLFIAHDKTQNKEWDRSNLECDELNTKFIGIIGFGRLGQIIAKYAEVFGMNVLVCEVDVKKCEEAKALGYEVVDLINLVRTADYVILLASWSFNNEKMISKTIFKNFKRSSYFINTSRGELIDEDGLLESLKNGTIKAAGLDVLNEDSSWFSKSPSNHPLIEYSITNNNLIITPHIGGYGSVSIQKTREFVTQKFVSNIKNKYY